MAKSAAERAREYRRRKRLKSGTEGLTLVGRDNIAALKHGAWSRDVPLEVAERLADPNLPDFIRAPVFAPAAAIAMRRVVQAERIGAWVSQLPPEQATTPAKAGSSSPAEIARHMDDSALRALGQLGLTPGGMVRFGKALEGSQQLDIALLQAAWAEQGESGA